MVVNPPGANFEVNNMSKVPFTTKEKLEEIAKVYPTPFHLYDEAGIRRNAENLK